MDITEYQLSCYGSPADERDIFYTDVCCANEDTEIPYQIDLPYQFNPKDQGSKNTCVSHAISEALEIIKSANEQFSAGFINANRRDCDWQRAGMIIREALVDLTKFGDVYNKDFPINEDYPAIKEILNKYGLDSLLIKASSNISKGFIRLWAEDIKRYITTEKKPIIIAIKVYDNFYEMENNGGIIPSIPSGNLKGSHCMLITGFKGDMLKILNSWGNAGDNGYVYLDVNSSIISELWGLTDEKVYNPTPVPIPSPSPTPSPVTPNVPTSEKLYRMQIEADYVREYADEKATELRNKGIDCCIKVYVTPKGTQYKIQVGAYKSYANSVLKRDEMIALGYKDAFITEDL